jgi:uncharacterized protein YdaT
VTIAVTKPGENAIDVANAVIARGELQGTVIPADVQVAPRATTAPPPTTRRDS